MYQYAATCRRVVDGDTLDLELDLGMGVRVRERFRLFGIDTPETYGVKKGSDEYKAGMKAKEFVEAAVMGGKQLHIDTYKDRKGKYGRYLATIIVDGENLNQLLVDNGLARVQDY